MRNGAAGGVVFGVEAIGEAIWCAVSDRLLASMAGMFLGEDAGDAAHVGVWLIG